MGVSEAIDLRCAACATPAEPEDRFCERCGARLGEAEPDEDGCRVCGAPRDSLDSEGFCSVCGARERIDRRELDLVTAAVVSDRGRVHHRNEDAFALAVMEDGGVAAVICDGISSSSAGDAAARSAAEAALAVLTGGGDDPDLVVAAVGAAQAAVAGVGWTTRADRGMPSCTLVSALWHDGTLAITSIGDSRAYWLDDELARQLTVDESWAQEQIEQGELTPEQAFSDRRSHSITNWIGADSPARSPRVSRTEPEACGKLVLCTDGLWNYLADAAELHELLSAMPADASPAAIAESLTETALARGGRDNITVAVIEIHPTGGPR
jgi:serine/threonine protein phosphatase PrpC